MAPWPPSARPGGRACLLAGTTGRTAAGLPRRGPHAPRRWRRPVHPPSAGVASLPAPVGTGPRLPVAPVGPCRPFAIPLSTPLPGPLQEKANRPGRRPAAGRRSGGRRRPGRPRPDRRLTPHPPDRSFFPSRSAQSARSPPLSGRRARSPRRQPCTGPTPAAVSAARRPLTSSCDQCEGGQIPAAAVPVKVTAPAGRGRGNSPQRHRGHREEKTRRGETAWAGGCMKHRPPR